MADLRDEGWLYPVAKQNLFWKQWATMYGGPIAWDALPQCVSVWAVMLLILCVDNLLKLASSEAVLGVDLEYNHEMSVGGFATLLNVFLVGSPAYMATKFNAINFGITHSVSHRLPTLVCAGFNGILFFGGFPLINYLPRFLLSGLLIFAAMPFLVENLWDARKRFNKLEFGAIWAVFLLNAVFGELLPQYGLLIAIAAGLIAASFAFAVHFARKSEQERGAHAMLPPIHLGYLSRRFISQVRGVHLSISGEHH